ncbi:MAG TPA: polysaccharide deacetylase family protein [Syntrophomonadaceae bacterium]|nr:polysaccharide deacetylase family protein [Syntrophomonadaceae bacterium]
MKKGLMVVFVLISLAAFTLGYHLYSGQKPAEIKSSVPTDKTVNAAATASNSKVIYKDKVVVLIYHHIDPHEVTGLVISPERFANHLAMLQTKGYHAISLDQLQQFLKGSPIPDNAVLITFDDGYESLYKYALPELKKYNMPAVNFDIVGKAGTNQSGLQYLDWNEMAEMAAAGFTTQSHTFAMHDSGILANGKQGDLISGPLKGQSQADFAAALCEDLKRSKNEIESHVQQPVYALAVPHGKITPTIVQAATKSGLSLLFSGTAGAVTRKSNPLALPRVVAGSPSVSVNELESRILRFTTTTAQSTVTAKTTKPAKK